MTHTRLNSDTFSPKSKQTLKACQPPPCVPRNRIAGSGYE